MHGISVRTLKLIMIDKLFLDLLPMRVDTQPGKRVKDHTNAASDGESDSKRVEETKIPWKNHNKDDSCEEVNRYKNDEREK